MKDLTFSILIPTYNGGATIRETLQSIMNQNFDNYEVIIQDDNSTDNTKEIIQSIGDARIKFFNNTTNLGYPANIENGRKHAKGDILYLMGQDDILAEDALLNTYRAFKSSEDIGAVTRPYYWFDKNLHTPVRAKKQLNPAKNETVTITDNYNRIITTFATLDQLSGLAMRIKFIDTPFHPDIFPCHVYPFASIMKKHSIIFLKDYNVAVRIQSSQSRHISSIYNKSPVQSWVDLFDDVFSDKKFKSFRKYMIKNFVAKNYVGLVQIKNYAKYKYLLREVYLLVKYRWQNLYNPVFWFFCLGTMFVPAKLLIPLVDWYKNSINKLRIEKIEFHVASTN